MFFWSRRAEWQSCDVGKLRGTHSTLKLHGTIVESVSEMNLFALCLIACSRNNVLCAEIWYRVFSLNNFPKGSPVLCQNGNSLFSK